MRHRSTRKIRPRLEVLEQINLLSAAMPTTPFVNLRAASHAAAPQADDTQRPLESAANAARNQAGPTGGGATALAARAPLAPRHPQQPPFGITMDRITNPTPFNAILTPPFQHVRVQTNAPVPGQVYNVLFLSVWNGTRQTFTANNGLTVRLSNQTAAHAYPILTGDQQWRPGQRIVFYVLTKQYYPLSPQVSAGFQFNFVNPRVTAIPGPSGIFLRLKYNPATFDQVLDQIVTSGPGAKGHTLGLPDTSIWEIIPQTPGTIRL